MNESFPIYSEHKKKFCRHGVGWGEKGDWNQRYRLSANSYSMQMLAWNNNYSPPSTSFSQSRDLFRRQVLQEGEKRKRPKDWKNRKRERGAGVQFH